MMIEPFKLRISQAQFAGECAVEDRSLIFLHASVVDKRI